MDSIADPNLSISEQKWSSVCQTVHKPYVLQRKDAGSGMTVGWQGFVVFCGRYEMWPNTFSANG